MVREHRGISGKGRKESQESRKGGPDQVSPVKQEALGTYYPFCHFPAFYSAEKLDFFFPFPLSLFFRKRHTERVSLALQHHKMQDTISASLHPALPPNNGAKPPGQ